ncbi:hypothetical protein [Gemmata obscuriglobus]|nr:hypothetical protein [Gemmata obscuriglobus]
MPEPAAAERLCVAVFGGISKTPGRPLVADEAALTFPPEPV